MQSALRYLSALCIVFLLMVYCDWYCTFILLGDEQYEPECAAFTLYKWQYSTEKDGLVIAQVLSENTEDTHGIMHVRLLEGKDDEVYFDIYEEKLKANTKYIRVCGIPYRVKYNGRAFMFVNGENIIQKLNKADTFSVSYRKKTYNFNSGKLCTQ